MLCQTCEVSLRAAFDARVKNPQITPLGPSTVLHRTPLSLYRSIIEGCYICRKTWMHILESKAGGAIYLQRAFEGDIPETYEEFYDQLKPRHPTSPIYDTSNNTQRSNESVNTVESLLSEGRYVVFQIYSTEDYFVIFIRYGIGDIVFYFWPASRTIPEIQSPIRSPSKDQRHSTAERPDVWRYWFQICSTSHASCRALEHKRQPFVPDRLIQILGDDEGNTTQWRLVEKCCREIDPSTSYVTLSHCWGSSEHLKLVKGKQSVFREASSTSDLSKTYQDAFQIATILGFHFIWIDSLCILQDDADDWKTQSSMMGSIYSDGRCNIAATWAADGTDGCFSPRDPCMIDATTIKLPFKDQLVDCDVDFHQHHSDEVERAPLNRRGWVVQERYLARKQLSFSKSQVYWECLESVASEQYPNGCPKATSVKDKPSVEGIKDDFLVVWADLVNRYSRCTLTRKSDKLIALAGLASEFQKATKDEYLAGLWKKDLHKQLCWSYVYYNHRPRISADVAPTWSWASSDGSVVMPFSDKHDADGSPVPLIQLIDTSVSKHEPADLHGVTHSKLVIRGVAGWARAGIYDERCGHNLKFQTTDQPRGIESSAMACTKQLVDIRWDEIVSSRDDDPVRWNELQEQQEGDLLVMWVTNTPSAIGNRSEGLLLRRFPGSRSENLFVRMGTFSSYGDSLEELIATRLGSPMTKHTVDLNDARLADLIHTVTII
ncbi:heterokaryon incompatibility protein-domain-containing protein [Hypoxylon rubiginosum]|uniref:Heterokaryon incompatibility protein-domain-containing protein n=1 Tax=Hypoxylon rubiginosum TaxID=110542 RepID=A0ACB9YNB2_9PEZI|nr:heterokaryon incompatibility protein-domain-containing protein [Hypoxylon rubiginosum]